MLDAINARLKAGKVGVRIEERGNKLYLVATLPPKTGSGKSKPYQQRLALGYNACTAGYRRAELDAKKLGVQIVEGTFQWEQPKNDYTVIEAIESFESAYFGERGRTDQTETTYRNYAHALKRLPKDRILTHELMIETIKTTEPNTRSRQLMVRSMKMLANHVVIS